MSDLWSRVQATFSGTVLGIPTLRWAVFLALVVAIFVGLRLVVVVARRRLKATAEKTPGQVDDYLLRPLEHTGNLGLLGIALFASLYFVDLRAPSAPDRDSVERTVRLIALLLIFVQAGRWGSSLIDVGLRQAFRYANFSQTAADTAFGVVKFFAMSALWASVAILILGALNVQVAPLIAGLGVGGIAVAFALQKILGDVFCSVAIVLDHPFEVGDFIITGDQMGSVEHIGVKTTRLRSLGGEQISIPNSDLVNSRVRNYKRMSERRVVFGFGVLYATPAETLEQIPGVVRAVVESIDATRFDRAHFSAFGDSALNFEVVYYVLSPDFNIYMDIQQRINLELLRRLGGMGVGFAFPTRTLYVDGMPATTRVELAPREGER